MLDLAPMERLTAERLAEALERREFFLEYQPVMDLVSGTAIGHEALIRWRHPVWGSVAPATFLDVAETSGLIVNIGDWVIEQATRDLASIPPDQWISVNLAPAQLPRRDLASSISSALVDAAADPGRLVLEITEGQLLEGTPAVLRRIEDLRRMGIRIAIDDFGSGYSSPAYLRPSHHVIKSSTRVCSSGELGERKQRILRWKAQLSTTVDALTIIEGVETRDQLQLVLQSGLRYAQGYALSRPAQLPAVRQPQSTPVVI
jgi:EAL domain-containing protein (putative c-di-GMP-specific phosphodiesterase class I)